MEPEKYVGSLGCLPIYKKKAICFVSRDPLPSSTMATPAPTLPNVQLLFGPMLIGVFVNMILYGVLISQVLTYFQVYSKDAIWMKTFVSFLFILETANTAFDMAFMYQPLILEYGQRPIFFPTFFVTEPLLIVAISTPIQLFFAWRIRSLTKSWWIPGVITILAIGSCAGGIWTAVGIQTLKTFANKPKLHNSALLWFLGSCVADVLITVSLVFSLSKRKTGFSGTDSVIDKIIRLTIQTGAITAVFSILDVICFMILPHAAVNFVWDLALSKLYTNCLMSTLNSRQSLNSGVSGSGVASENRRVNNNTHGFIGGQQATSPTSRIRNPDTFVDASRHTYELETQKSGYDSYDVESGFARPHHEEFGIQVTKVIEHVKDPIPHPYTQ
ncbi:MFS domain-containing protein [Mycena indigotica]|uniref:MFS domain-containing protein n=1 Tax=Mycena indigotica TaxID=2126181 RepID=A0A8H6WFQ7_9AGAR|nr:MFS domain-containing protein [Mycena indigotica]KAF7315001.1 MFS domain-containing protein [Mycena indigotica]